MLQQFKPDMVILDEGHHFPASSWDTVSAAACLVNPDCKFVLLTATPARGDA
jgi:superfamily II DNA or RNA helicase